MPPTKQVQEFLDLINGLEMPPLADQGVDAAREGYVQLAATEGPQVGSVHDHAITTGQHGDFVVRSYHPLDTQAPTGVLVWIHGGGFVVGDLSTADSTCRTLANEAGVVVVSVDYHRAPEHSFPAAIDDVVTAIQWVVDNAGDLGVDPQRLAVGGDSAGGNLSAVACQLARAAGGPSISYQLLVYPAVDLVGDYPSRRDNADGYFLTSANMVWFGRQYLSGRDPATPRVSPIRATDLSGLPPAMVITAQYDPLRDEGIAYAQALAAAGVPVEHHHFESEIHGFFDFDFLPDCADARVRASTALRAALAIG